MGIGTLRIQDLEYGQSHLTDGARRPRRLYSAIITANGAQTKAELKRCIGRRDRRAFTVELAHVEILDAAVEPIVAEDDEPQFASFAEWLETMNDEHPLVDPDADWTDDDYAQMLQALEDDGVAFDVPTSSIYGDTVELWDADEWTQQGFSITTLR